MAWDWIEKGAKRLQELGGDYKQHHALIERLITIDPAAVQEELTRAWLAMDDRARAGVKLTLAGLVLSQQAAPSSAESKLRLERLKALSTLVDRIYPDAPAAGVPASKEARFASGAARVTNKLADVAERARPKAGELIDSARKGIEKHGPAVEAAVKSAISDLLKADTPPPGESTTISGTWSGTLHAGAEALGCDLQVAASGRPVWAFHDTNGFQGKELTHTGQRLQYVPPGGGVTTVTVQSVTGSATETGYVIDYSFEGTSNGYLTQKYQRIVLIGRLRGSQLDVTFSESGLSSFGDKTGLTPTEGATEYSGSLTKQA
jgi:hypothetical protein